jgi:hypothetical protein
VEGEIHQVASAMLVLVFAAVMLVFGLFYIERSDRPFEGRVQLSSTISVADEPGAVRSHK